jgi:hypothetical protein
MTTWLWLSFSYDQKKFGLFFILDLSGFICFQEFANGPFILRGKACTYYFNISEVEFLKVRHCQNPESIVLLIDRLVSNL